VIEGGWSFIPREAIADQRPVSAWKLRAGVYGLLAVVCALVLWQSGALADDPEGHILRGRAPNGSPVDFVMQGETVSRFSVARVCPRCVKGWSIPWGAWSDKPHVEWRQTGSRLVVRERPQPRVDNGWSINLWMRARVTDGGDRMKGVVWYTARQGRHFYAPPPAPFTATRKP